MNDIIVTKLKKYLLFISCFLFISLGTHLFYLYLYEGSTSEAQSGGTISEAIIGTFPHLNPLIPSNDHNAYINDLLYRSLLQYSPQTGNLEADLANCNTENLLYIECSLEANLLWSDDNPITPDDIAGTLNLIQETKVNPILASLLEKTQIEVGENSIIFKNQSKDINFLQVLMQPIIPKKIADTLTTQTVDGKFSEIGGIYSGRFVLASISQDDTVGITKITLGKNEKYYGNELYIQFLILNLFRDQEHFLKNKNSFNIFNDRDSIIGESIPRLASFDYYISQFVGNFLNTETLPIELRSYIIFHTSREKIIEDIGVKSVFSALNPFLSEKSMETETQKDFDINAYMEKKGYYSKKSLLKIFLEQSEKEKPDPQISQEATPVEIPRREQSELSFVTTPNTQKYNFVSEDNILVQGKVESGVDAVYINDYKLNGFSAGDDIFSYRLLQSFDSIQEGENTYTVYFEKNGKKEIKEQFIYIYEPDVDKLATLKENFFSKEAVEPAKDIVAPEIQKQAPKILSTLSSEEIQKLDDALFYTPDGKAFEIELVYTLGDERIEKTALSIQKQLKEAGISIKITPYTLADISVALRNENLRYDTLLIGINLGYFGSNIFPYFHSSQVKNGYNFSNFKKLGLDILLEELTSNKLPVSQQQQLQEKMLDILSQESVLQVFYTPKIQLLVDKNIKDFSLPEYLPDSRHRFTPLLSAYLSEKKTMILDGKGVFDFFIYLVKILLS